MEAPKCCEESEMGGGEDEGSVAWEGRATWDEEGEEPEEGGG